MNTYLIKPFITVCLALLFALGGLAQDQSKIDSLNVACGELKPDSNRVNCLIELSGEWLVADPTTSLQYSTLALELAQSLGHQEILIKAHKATALSHGYLLDPESSKPHYLEAIILLDQLGDENRKGNMYLNLGADYIYTAQYDSCMHYLLKALPIYRSVGNKLGVSKVHNNLAIAYRHMGYFNEAISTYRQSIAYKKEVDNREGLMNTYLNMTALYYQMNDYDSAQVYGGLCESLAQELEDPRTEGLALLNLSLVNKDLKHYTIARDFGLRSEKLMLPYNDQRQLRDLYSNLAGIYSALDLCDSALYYVQRSHDQGEDNFTPTMHKQNHLVLATCAQKSGHYKEAAEHMKLYALYTDTVYNIDQQRRLAEMTYKYQQEVLHSNLLENEKALSESEAQRSRLVAVIVGISGVLAVLVLTLLMLNVRAKRRREKHEAELGRQIHKIDLLQSKLATLADAPLPEVALGMDAHQVNQLLVNPMTERELEVLSMIATGKSNQEIADLMFVSINTVKTHIHRIYEKLDVKNRTEATLKAGSLNLIGK